MSRLRTHPLTIDISSDSDSDSIQADDPLPSTQVIDLTSSDDEEGGRHQGSGRFEDSPRLAKTKLSKSPFPSPLISTHSSASQSPRRGGFRMPAPSAEAVNISRHNASNISSDEGGNARSAGDEWSQDDDEEESREYMTFIGRESHTDASEYEEEEHFGMEMRDETVTQSYPSPDTDYAFLAQRYYLDSKKRRLLRYQQEEVDRHQATKRWDREKPMLRLPPIPHNVLSTIFREACRFLEIGQAVDWITVSRCAYEQTGNEIDSVRCRKVFEYSIQEYPQKVEPRKPADVTGRMSFLKMKRLRELRPRYTRLYRDRMMMTQVNSYKCATTFDFSSGSVVDFALKANGSGMKLAIANIATSDIYNRPGNLILCDIDAGVVKRLHGHETRARIGQTFQELVTSVNDVKLSYSESFFITGSNDKRTMIWNSDTGERTFTIQNTGHINQIATVVDSMNAEDVFATCSSDGSVDIFSLDSYGRVKARNRRAKKNPLHTRPRVASCVSFGREYYWDCLAVGLEGFTEGQNANDQHGMIEFYDANTETKKAELEFKRAGNSTIAKSVSCLSFCPTGNTIVCGTSGRSSEVEEMGDGLARLFDVRYAKQVQVAQSGHGDVNIVDFSPCGQYIISCSSSNEIAVFDRRFITEAPLHQFAHQDRIDGESHGGVTSALWLPQGSGSSESVLLTTGGDGVVRTWDLRQATNNAPKSTLEVNLGPLARAVASPMYEHLVVGSDMGAVSIFTMNGGFMEKYRSREMVLLSNDM